MTLIIGGAGQGKLRYALSLTGLDVTQAGESPEGGKPIFNHLEAWLKEETDPLPALQVYLRQQPRAVILCDEVGCGVVPMDRACRDWRERVGRTCCTLAEWADQVIRVHCGIPMVLKGELYSWN